MAKAVLTTKEGLTITVEGTAVSKAIMAFGTLPDGNLRSRTNFGDSKAINHRCPKFCGW